MIYKETYPTNIQEGQWDEKTCVRRQSGFVVDETNLASNLRWLPKGAPLAILESGKVAVVKTAKLYEAAAASATSIKVYKSHALVTGNKIGGSTISAINTDNTNYDVLTISALSKKADKDSVLDDGNASKVIGLNYATIELDGQQSCTPTVQAYEIDEDSLPYPLSDDIKTALTSRHAFKVNY